MSAFESTNTQLTLRWGLPYHGQSGLQTGFLVAFTQLIPEHQIQVLGVVKMRVKVCLPFHKYGREARPIGPRKDLLPDAHPDIRYQL
jgi:hypothetical protein